MKLLLLAAAFTIACTSGGSTTHIRGAGEAAPRAEIRIENNNWNQVRVYLLAGADFGGRIRVATVSANTEETVYLRVILPTFRFYVTLLADANYWISEEWNDQQYTCLSVVIHNYLPHSYVIPCRRRRKGS